jgi:hypothetical protein
MRLTSDAAVGVRLQVYGLMDRGAEQRATGATKLNEMSSRSHAVRGLLQSSGTI